MSNPNPSPATRFRKGHDPRRFAGKKPQPFNRALATVLTEKDAAAIVAKAIADAKAGDAVARAWLADRLEGKPIARNEEGQPGEFEVGLDQARKVLRIVGGKDA